MLKVTIEENALRFGERFTVSFQRTLRVPEDGGMYPLPPGLGAFPISRIADYAERVPAGWRERGGVFIPVYRREALWLGLGGGASSWKPCALQVAVGGVNAVSGGAWKEALTSAPQNYLVCPPQLWLDGINGGEGFTRQFVAMPSGEGYTVEEQLTGKADFGGIQLRVYEPLPGRFPDQQPPPPSPDSFMFRKSSPMRAAAMGLGAGGHIEQKIYPDPHGIETWDAQNFGVAFVHLVNSEQYESITGHAPPPTSVDARTYTEHGLPWFDLYKEDAGDVGASARLAGVKSIRERDAEKGESRDATDESVSISAEQKIKLRPRVRQRKSSK